MRALLLACVVWAMPVWATTYYVDCVNGNDAAAGTVGVPWKTYGKVNNRINANGVGAGALLPDDQVYFKGGQRCHVTNGAFPQGWTITGQGGTAGHPITLSIDPATSGDLEIVGAVIPNLSDMDKGVFGTNAIATSWRAARTCASGPWMNAPCDADADCTVNSGSGTCSNTPTAVYWTRVDAGNDTTGNTPGTAFQAGVDSGGVVQPGLPPKFFEVLYSPQKSDNTETVVRMPTFTAGRDQVWVYTEKAAQCYSAGSPWPCCTAFGVGATCGGTNDPVLATPRSGRVYVHVAGGTQPQFAVPPVEIPYGGQAIMYFHAAYATPTKYLTWTNNGTGKITFFRWAEKLWLLSENAHHIVFEDTDWGYNSGIAVPGANVVIPPLVLSGSGWPRDNGGPYYGIHLVAQASRASHHFTFQRSSFHDAQDELLHIGHFTETGAACTIAATCTALQLGDPVCDCAAPVGGACVGGTGVCVYPHSGNNVFDRVTFRDSPGFVANGSAPNAASPVCSWPPVGYQNLTPFAWEGIFPACGYTGGGGQSPSCIIDAAPNETFTHINTSGCGNFSAENSTNAPTDSTCWNWLVEDSTFDFATNVSAASSKAVLHPASQTTQCSCGPSGNGIGAFCVTLYGARCCGGFQGIRGVNLQTTFSRTNVAGTRFKNNIIINGYGYPLQLEESPLLNVPALGSNIVVNNTIVLEGNPAFESVNGQIDITAHFDGVWANNNIWHHGPLLGGTRASIAISAINTLTMNNNNYFGANMRFSYGGTFYTTPDAYKAALVGVGYEQDSLGADPLFVGGAGYGAYDLQAASPLRNAGLTVADNTEDRYGIPRPQEAIYDIGAMEVSAGATTSTTLPVSTTSTSTTSSSSTSVPATTSTTLPPGAATNLNQKAGTRSHGPKWR